MNDITELQFYYNPFGYLDLKECCRVGDILNISERKLFEIIDSFRESCGIQNYADIDPVYCVYNYILQMARNTIAELIQYDFINDYKGSESEIYTYGNYCATSYDYSLGAFEELESMYKQQKKSVQQQLISNKYVKFLFDNLGIDYK